MDGTELKPFFIYFTGLKLSYLWEFGKEASKYTHAKPVPIPMFAMTVRLSTEKVKNSVGFSWVIKFEIVRNEENNLKLVTDPGEFQFLKDMVTGSMETVATIIEKKANESGVAIEEDNDIPAESGEEKDLF